MNDFVHSFPKYLMVFRHEDSPYSRILIEKFRFDIKCEIEDLKTEMPMTF